MLPNRSYPAAEGMCLIGEGTSCGVPSPSFPGKDSLMQQQQVPEITIPATDEVVMKGVTAQFMPNIMKCNMGGWIVVVPRRGISAHTSLDQAIAFVGSEAHATMGEAEDFPDILTKEYEELPERRSISGIVHSIIALTAIVLGVKIV